MNAIRSRRAVACAVIGVTMPAAVLAHGALRSSSPASGATLTIAPRELRLTFNEAPELAFTRIELTGPDGLAVRLSPPRIPADSPRVVIAEIRGALVAGRFRVAWQIASADGHPVRGRFSFSIAEGAAGLPPDSGIAHLAAAESTAAAAVTAPTIPASGAAGEEAVAGGFSAESPSYAVVRFITFSAILVVIGAVVFSTLVLRVLRNRAGESAAIVEEAGARAAAVALVAVVVLALVLLARLYAQSLALRWTGGFSWNALRPMMTQTLWGWGWLLQGYATVVAAIGLILARRRVPNGWMIAALGAALLSVTPALSGHAVAGRYPTVAMVGDALHVTGASGWLGTLLIVLAVGLPLTLGLDTDRRARATADLVNAFSPYALAFASLAAVTGVAAAWMHIEPLAALWQTRYGRLLLLKLAVLSLVFATGAYNWLRVRPALGSSPGADTLRRSAVAELVIGVVVLAVTAWLVATPTPASEVDRD